MEPSNLNNINNGLTGRAIKTNGFASLTKKSPLALTSSSSLDTSPSNQAKRKRKRCSRADCAKVDAGGGFCVAHGGGKKCSFAGCTKGSQTGGFCRQHGGGSRCQVPGCDKVDAGKGLCRAHGGGKRCQGSGCLKADVGGGFCTSHGGGKRCQHAGCKKIDQGGGKCRAHGGVRRCRKENCQQPARGSTGFCTDHGGAKICSTPQCRRLAKETYGLVCSGCFAKKKNNRNVLKPSPVISEQTFGSTVTLVCSSTSPLGSQVTTASSYTLPSPFGSPFQSPLVGPSDVKELNPLDISTQLNELSTSSSSYSLVMASANDLLAAPAGHPSSDSCWQDETVENCLLNDCRKMFGGECNCLSNCNCNHATQTPTPTPTQPRVHIQAQAQAQAQQSQSLPQVQPQSHPPTASPAAWKLDPSIMLRRLVIQIGGPAANSVTKANETRALIKQLPCVRNVYSLDPCRCSASSFAMISQSSASSSSRLQLSVWGNDTLTFDLLCAIVSQYQQGPSPSMTDWSLELVASSQWAWVNKRVTLHVPAMMCVQNCGGTIVRALLQHDKVQRARVVFEKRHIVVCGSMTLVELESTLEEVGFEGKFVRMVPWPKLFGFHLVINRPTNDFNGNDNGKLEDEKAQQEWKIHYVLQQRVEGVEYVKVMIQDTKVLILVAALLEDATTILNEAAKHGILLQQVLPLDQTVEEDFAQCIDSGATAGAGSYSPLVNDLTDDENGSSHDITSPDFASSVPLVHDSFAFPIDMMAPLHSCDLDLCARNGCKQYMATLAHTAALAVGWSVPGCSMSWGGECTCDENCRCHGCPKHNPL